MEKGSITTIQVSKETKENLKNLGKKGETYNDIIRKLLKSTEEGEK